MAAPSVLDRLQRAASPRGDSALPLSPPDLHPLAASAHTECTTTKPDPRPCHRRNRQSWSPASFSSAAFITTTITRPDRAPAAPPRSTSAAVAPLAGRVPPSPLPTGFDWVALPSASTSTSAAPAPKPRPALLVSPPTPAHAASFSSADLAALPSLDTPAPLRSPMSRSSRRHTVYASPTSLTSSNPASPTSPSSAATEREAKAVRRRSLAARDLFANGERDAVRCRPNSLWLAADLLSGAPPEDELAALVERQQATYMSALPPRRSSLPQQQQAAMGHTQPRRHSEQAPSSFYSSDAPPLPSTAFSLTSTSTSSARRPSLSPVERLSSPPGASPVSSASPVSRRKSISAVRRKPVPALAIEDDLETVQDPLWDGSSPPLAVGLVKALEWPPRFDPPVPAPAQQEREEEEGGLSSIEDKVRRMSLETSESGATGLGLGLRPAPPVEVEPPRKTLRELKAEKLALRRATAGSVQVQEGETPAQRVARRATEGSLPVQGFALAIDPVAANKIPSVPEQASPAYSHGSTTSASGTTTSSMSRSSSNLSTSTPPTVSSTSRRTFRPFALVRQQRARPLGIPLSPPGLQQEGEADLVDAWMDIIVGQREPSEEEEEEDDQPTPSLVFGASPPSRPTLTLRPLSHSRDCPPAPLLAAHSPVSPRTPAVAAVPPPMAQTQALRPLIVPYGPETVSALASSLPPLIYGRPAPLPAPAPTPAPAPVQDVPMLPVRGEDVSSSSEDEFHDASEGRPSLDSVMRPASPAALPAFDARPRENKRTASASFLDKATSPPVVFASVPASPAMVPRSMAPLAPLAPGLASPPLAPPPTKRPHLSFSPPAPALSKSTSKSKPGKNSTDKPLPPRPPRPLKSARRSVNIASGEGGRRASVASAGSGSGSSEGGLGACPVLLGRVPSLSSESGESSVEGIKFERALSAQPPLLTLVL
ncbi:hypothetical protein JCM10207_001037 [Rhodosporidiobolus poonsookiae]